MERKDVLEHWALEDRLDLEEREDFLESWVR